MQSGEISRRRFTENDTGAGLAATEPPSVLASEIEESDGAELAIETEYRGKLASIRKLPRHAQPAAKRGARDWKNAALRSLQEKRAMQWRALRRSRPRVPSKAPQPRPQPS